MTVTDSPPQVPQAPSAALAPPSTGLASVVGTADHKVVGRLFIGTSLLFLLASGVIAQFVAIERAEIDVMQNDTVFRAFTFHSISGTFLFLLPMLLGIALVVVPLQVGASTVAFPRAAASAYWTFLFSGVLLLVSYAIDGGPEGSSEAGVDLWAASFVALLVALLLATVCVVTTVAALRTRGMGLSMVPMFSWSVLVGGTLWILSLPVLAATLVLIYVDHKYGQQSFGSEPDIYPRIVWAFRQPQVYAFAVPVLGIITDSLTTITGRRLASRPAAMGAIGLFGALSFGAFLQRSTNPESVEQPLFVIMSLVAVLPLMGLLGLWADVLRRGKLRLAAPLVLSLVAAAVLLVAVIVGGILSIPPLDMTYTVAAFGQSHFTVMGASIGAFAGLWLWATKIVGRPLPEGAGIGAAALLLLGTIALALPDVISGASGEGDDATLGIKGLNMVIAVGGVLTLLGILAAVSGLIGGLRRTSDAEVAADAWGTGSTLEWATASPPAHGNFTETPVVTSADPLFDKEGQA